MLRCIHCGRGTNKVTLSDSFTCIDKKDCAAYTARVKSPIQQVCIYHDAACLGGNVRGGQPLGIGVYTLIAGVHSPEFSGCKMAGVIGSNMDGEWIALIYALKIAWIMRKSGNYSFRFFCDNQVVVNCFHDYYRTGSKFKKYYHLSKNIQQQLGARFLGLTWIPREKNTEADKLSKDALLLIN